MSPAVRKKKSRAVIKSISLVKSSKTPAKPQTKEIKVTPKFDPKIHGTDLEFDYESDDSFTRKITFSARKNGKTLSKSPIRRQIPPVSSKVSHTSRVLFVSTPSHSKGGNSKSPFLENAEVNPFRLTNKSLPNTPKAALLQKFSFPNPKDCPGPISSQYQRITPLNESPKARKSPEPESFPKISVKGAKNDREIASANSPKKASPLNGFPFNVGTRPVSANKETIFNSIGKAIKGVVNSPRNSMIEQWSQLVINRTPSKTITTAGPDTPATTGTPTMGHRRRPTVPVEFRFVTEERIQNRYSGMGVATTSISKEPNHQGPRSEGNQRPCFSLKRRRRSQDSSGEPVDNGDVKRRKIEEEALNNLRTKARDSGIASVEAWARQKQICNDL